MTRTGKAISDQQPLVSHLERAAWLLRLDPHDLAAAITSAQLEPWGEHAQGHPVYRWEALLEAAVAAGLPVPERKAHTWRRRPAVVGRTVNPYGVEL